MPEDVPVMRFSSWECIEVFKRSGFNGVIALRASDSDLKVLYDKKKETCGFDSLKSEDLRSYTLWISQPLKVDSFLLARNFLDLQGASVDPFLAFESKSLNLKDSCRSFWRGSERWDLYHGITELIRDANWASREAGFSQWNTGKLSCSWSAHRHHKTDTLTVETADCQSVIGVNFYLLVFWIWELLIRMLGRPWLVSVRLVRSATVWHSCRMPFPSGSAWTTTANKKF